MEKSQNVLDKCARNVYIVNEHKTCTKGDGILNSEAIAKTLVELRGEKSREEVANALNISVSAVKMYEAGERIPRDDIKIRIAKYYGKSVDAIFFTNEVHV